MSSVSMVDEMEFRTHQGRYAVIMLAASLPFVLAGYGVLEWLYPTPSDGPHWILRAVAGALVWPALVATWTARESARFPWRVRTTPTHLELSPSHLPPTRLPWSEIGHLAITGWGPFARLKVSPRDLTALEPILADAFTPAQIDRMKVIQRRHGAVLVVPLHAITPGRETLRRTLTGLGGGEPSSTDRTSAGS